jgi:hypothetical protein
MEVIRNSKNSKDVLQYENQFVVMIHLASDKGGINFECADDASVLLTPEEFMLYSLLVRKGDGVVWALSPAAICKDMCEKRSKAQGRYIKPLTSLTITKYRNAVHGLIDKGYLVAGGFATVNGMHEKGAYHFYERKPLRRY